MTLSKTEATAPEGGTVAPLTYSHKEAAQVLGVGVPVVMALIEAGKLASVRAGRRVLIPRAAVTAFLQGAADSVLDMTPLEFLHMLYAGVATGNAWVEFRRPKTPTPSMFMPWPPTFEQHPDAMTPARLANWTAKKQNVYFGVALRKENTNGKAANCKVTCLVWADLDLADFPELCDGQSKESLLQAPPEGLAGYKRTLLARLLEVATAHDLPPRAIVDSGHGLQAYWARPCGSTAEDTERFNRALATLLGADLKACDIARVLRVPGSNNFKNPERPLPVQVVWADEAATVTDEALAALPLADKDKPKQKPSKTPASSSKPASDEANPVRRYALAALEAEAAALAGTGEGGRNDQLNKAAFAAGQLVGAGALSEDEAQQALEQAALAAGLDDSETRATLRSGLEAGKAEPRDLSNVGTLVGKLKGEAPSNPALSAKAQVVAAEAVGLPSADQIPDPEGEGGSYSDAQVIELLGLPWPVVAADTDKAHAHRLRAVAGDNLGYVPELGGYVAWGGQQWLSGGKDGPGQNEARRYVQRLGLVMKTETEKLLSLYGVLAKEARRLEAANASKEEVSQARARANAMQKAYFAHVRAAKSTESDKKQQAILSSAKPLYPKSVKDFEPRPWVVGFPNGTWDKGNFRAAQRTDHMLTLAAVAYDPSADRSDWLEVLDRITGGDAELARTLQDVAGYALSGASTLRLLPWLYGEGGTGKSTFSELLATLLGDLAATIDPKLFTSDAARERLGAAIWGKRVALCAEAGNTRLDAEALKTLSGGDRLSVRMLYSEGFTARASHVLLMVANDAPRVEAYDDALKDRVLALPFTHRLDSGPQLLGGQRLEEVRQDPSSPLVKGFAAWAVEGLKRVFSAGDVYRAPACKAATQVFWTDVDPLADFWLTCDRSALAVHGWPVADMRQAYEEWAKVVGARPLNAQRLGKACRSVGLEQVKKTGGKRVWALVNPALFPSDPSGAAGQEWQEWQLLPQFPKSSPSNPLAKEGSKDFWENTPKVATLATNEPLDWEGEEL